MGFPQTLEDLKKAAALQENRGALYRAQQHQALEDAKLHDKAAQHASQFVDIIRELLDSWFDSHNDGTFFLSDSSHMRVVVREFIHPDNGAYAYYPVVPLAGVWHQACPTCGGPAPVIERGPTHIQLLVCPDCDVIQTIDE